MQNAGACPKAGPFCATGEDRFARSIVLDPLEDPKHLPLDGSFSLRPMLLVVSIRKTGRSQHKAARPPSISDTQGCKAALLARRSTTVPLEATSLPETRHRDHLSPKAPRPPHPHLTHQPDTSGACPIERCDQGCTGRASMPASPWPPRRRTSTR